MPTLIVCGTADPVTTPADGRFLQQRIAGAQLLELPAAHLSNVEAGAAFTRAVVDFLRQ
ncbi:3-oxoadipate enol-lactonase 2 [compost metagenome]